MDIVRSEPQSFLDHVAASHVDRLLCPAADELRGHAEGAFRYARRSAGPNGNPIWISKGTHKTRVKEAQVTFTLVTPRTTRVRKSGIQAQTISLIVNGDLLNPVALILPAPDSDNSCASVVVGGEINNPDHIKEITPIIENIQRNSWPMGY